MNIDKKNYEKYAQAHAPKSPIVKDCLKAFLVGGGICALAQGFLNIYGKLLGLDEETAGTLTSVTLIFIAVVLTAVGVFDKIAKHAGAGTLVPITGFANSVVSPAIDSKSEGFILGVGAKIFTVAGPVLLYGTLAGAIYGVILWIFGLV
ncbi:MAG: stage V sporulation protein AC [Clostridia bacterium]|nr:stage V sporulation protein AC [Clostridia bacterium]